MTDYLAVAPSGTGGDGQSNPGDRYLNAGAIAADGPPLRVPGDSAEAILRLLWRELGKSD